MLTTARVNSRLKVDIRSEVGKYIEINKILKIFLTFKRARDNAGRLPRHYIDEDKFESHEIDVMRRRIGEFLALTGFRHRRSTFFEF